MSSLQDFLMIKVYWRLYKSQSFLPNIFSLWSTKIFAHCGQIAHWHSLTVGPHMYQSPLQALFRHVLSHTSLPNCWRQSILKLGPWHRKARAWRELNCCVISQRCSLVRIRRHQTKHLYGNFVQTTLAVYTLIHGVENDHDNTFSIMSHRLRFSRDIATVNPTDPNRHFVTATLRPVTGRHMRCAKKEPLD